MPRIPYFRVPPHFVVCECWTASSYLTTCLKLSHAKAQTHTPTSTVFSSFHLTITLELFHHFSIAALSSVVFHSPGTRKGTLCLIRSASGPVSSAALLDRGSLPLVPAFLVELPTRLRARLLPTSRPQTSLEYQATTTRTYNPYISRHVDKVSTPPFSHASYFTFLFCCLRELCFELRCSRGELRIACELHTRVVCAIWGRRRLTVDAAGLCSLMRADIHPCLASRLCMSRLHGRRCRCRARITGLPARHTRSSASPALSILPTAEYA